MAHTLGGVTFGAHENPFDGEINYARQTRWSTAAPLGYTGNINSAVGIAPLMHKLVCYLDSTTMLLIKALADAAAGGTTHAWVYTDGDIGITSQTVLIKSFIAKKTAGVRGAAVWDCELELEEQP